MSPEWRNIRVVFLLQVAIVCLVVVLCMLGLDAANGEVVADSAEGYVSKFDCEYAIGLVRSTSQSTPIVDVSG